MYRPILRPVDEAREGPPRHCQERSLREEAIMPSNAHDDIRKLLKEFGLTADETVSAYFIEEKPAQPLRLRIVLEDVTPYEKAPSRPLRVEVAGDVRP
jgi:sulfite reductase alpha subunit-like flavoprotein